MQGQPRLGHVEKHRVRLSVADAGEAADAGVRGDAGVLRGALALAIDVAVLDGDDVVELQSVQRRRQL